MNIDADKVLNFIVAAGALGEKVAVSEAAREKRASEVEARIPDVIAALISGDRLVEGDREKMARVLRDPVATLGFIERLAAHRNGAESLAMGRPVGREKQAGADDYNSLTSNLAGVPTSRPKESDIRFLEKLGIAPGA